MSRNFFKFNLIHIHYHPSIHPSTMPELSAVEYLAELQATKKKMEEQEAELNVAAEEEQQAAEAAKKAEEKWVATEKKVAKKLSKKWKTVEPAAGQVTEGSEAPKKKKVKMKVLEEDMHLLVEAAMVACKQ
jgi:hypothetical protein